MYIAINNATQKAVTANQKTIIANYIGVHRNTITNNLTKGNPCIIGAFTVYEAEFFKDKVTAGNRDKQSERIRKALIKDGYSE